MEALLDRLDPLDGLSDPRARLCFRRSFIRSLTQDEVRSLRKQFDLSAGTFAELAAHLETEFAGSAENPKLEEVCQRIDQLLASGGDDRLTLVETYAHKFKVNKYYCSATPRSDIISRGSCTCNQLTFQNYEIAKDTQKRLLDSLLADTNLDVFEVECNNIRKRLHKVLRVAEDISSIVLFPSGSDAELLPTIIGLIRSSSKSYLNPPQVVNFILASGEVGSGTSKAASGCHFSDTPTFRKDSTVRSGERLVGIAPDSIKVVEYKARDQFGSISLREEDILASIHLHLAQSESSVAILHAVCGSKTGIVYPSMATLRIAKEKFQDRIILVVDACQLRCHLSQVQEYLAFGAVVLFTGSKFFGGPPFSGAVALPEALYLEIEEHLNPSRQGRVVIPTGLSSYLTPNDIPENMPRFRDYVSAHSLAQNNIGLILRWNCALSTMEQFSRIPSSFLDLFVVNWVSHMKQTIQKHEPFISVFENCGEDGNQNGAEMPGQRCSIISFVVRAPNRFGQLENLGFEEMKKFHFEMTQSKFGPCCFLGQPVLLSPNGLTVLRIALGAEMVTSLFSLSDSPDVFKLAEIYSQDEILTTKMRSICEHNWWNKPRYYGPFATKNWTMEKSMLKIDNYLSLNDELLATNNSPSASRLPFGLTKLLQSHTFNTAILYDVDSLHQSFSSVQSSFPSNFLHCYAIKSCPLPYILHRAVECGLGLEAASLVEVQLALQSGCHPQKIMFDSPCKSYDEIVEALLSGVCLNANTFNEIMKIESALSILTENGICYTGKIGLRINPLVGAGAIEELSTATDTSKFGVRLTSLTRKEIIDCYTRYSFLNSLMSHVGSQGVSLSLMAEAVSILCQLADDIDSSCGSKRVEMIDIGGGLPVNYDSDEISPTFAQYASLLSERCNVSTVDRLFVTEFGKAHVLKSASVITRVEDIIFSQDVSTPTIAIVHAGSDLFMRPAYVPSKFYHRISLFDHKGVPKTSPSQLICVAGPLCHSADFIAKNIILPQVSIGDFAIISDAGANTLSTFSKHCSRLTPPIFCFRVIENRTHLAIIKEEESFERALEFWT